MFVSVLSVYRMHVLCLWLAEEGVESVRTGVTEGWKPLPCKCWESLTEVLCDQLVLVTTGPSLQPGWMFLLVWFPSLSVIIIKYVRQPDYTRRRLLFSSQF